MHCNIRKTDVQNFFLIHLHCATHWKPLWFNLLTSIDTKLDHNLENIYRGGDDFARLLCIYSKACKVGFMS